MEKEKTSSGTKRSRDESDHRKHRSRESDEKRSSRDHSSDHHRRLDRDERSRDAHRHDDREIRNKDRSVTHKRKGRRGDSEDSGDDGGEKRVRVSEEGRKERRRFGDKASVEDGNGRSDDCRMKDDGTATGSENLDNSRSGDIGKSNGSGFRGNGSALEPLSTESGGVPETSVAPGNPVPIKVSSITTTHENKGVDSNRSHEVIGKSSTDGASSTAGKSATLSLDALAKAKKALQMRKELAEKMKKIPILNKDPKPSPVNLKSEPKEVLKPGSLPSASSIVSPSSSGTAIPNIDAVKRAQELAARMGFRHDPEFAPLINMFPGQSGAETALTQRPTKAPVLLLDALGREIDEHGNVVNVAKPSSLTTLKVNINKQKKEAFQIIQPDLDVDPASNPFYDEGMGLNKNKLLRPKRMNFLFVEEGKWSKDAEHIKLKSQFGEAQAKEHKAKQAQLTKAKGVLDINPNLIEVSERVIKEKTKEPIPEVEWWDVPLLRSGNYGDTGDEGIVSKEAIKLESINIYVQHPRPIEPPAEPAPPPPQPLKVTKKEQKKLRTQKRLARERERQEMIRQGLLEPPKPKVKMSNLMKVLGAEATQDPTRLEKEIRSAAAEREQAHIDRNAARKLTPAERREKKERKLFDEPNASAETTVSVYRINQLSHPQTRFKVDIFARENRLSGCAAITDNLAVVVVEGGSKSIKRYGKVMLRRINWANAVREDEDGDEQDEKPANKCVLVWQGSVARPAFNNRFYVHDCMTEAAARKIYSDAGVVHYWDLAANFTEDGA